jgi:hypothetical protein
MSLFKGIKQSKERQKAKAFYESAANLPAGTRETRKLRSVLGNRTAAFIDMTFIDGARRTEAYIEAMNAQGKESAEKPSAPCYREVRTVGGTVWVYLPQSYCDQYFILGSKYQQSIITPATVFEISDTLAHEISEALMLDHQITPLQFLNDASASVTARLKSPGKQIVTAKLNSPGRPIRAEYFSPEQR